MTEQDLLLIQEKHAQLDTLLPTLEADIWIIYARELSDPSTSLFAGFDVIGETAFVFGKDGKKIAVVTDYDRHDAEAVGVYDEVIASSSSFAETLQSILRPLKAKSYALNFSKDDHLCDGLTRGLFLKLKEIVDNENFEGHIASSQHLLEPLRAQKSPEEIRRIREAIKLTEKILLEVDAFIKPNMSERQVVDFIKERQRFYQTSASFGDGANVMAGRNGIGHRSASDKAIAPGDTLLIDIGCFYQGYTSDIQRAYYVLDEGETDAPAEVNRRFQIGQEAMHKAIRAMAPGKRGADIDAISRTHLERNGIRAYPHALGHQIGRTVHDGGTLLSPIGARYGNRGNAPLVAAEVYTVEPVIHGTTGLDGHPIGIEQDVLMTQTGTEILSTPQQRLILIG